MIQTNHKTGATKSETNFVDHFYTNIVLILQSWAFLCSAY